VHHHERQVKFMKTASDTATYIYIYIYTHTQKEDTTPRDYSEANKPFFTGRKKPRCETHDGGELMRDQWRIRDRPSCSCELRRCRGKKGERRLAHPRRDTECGKLVSARPSLSSLPLLQDASARPRVARGGSEGPSPCKTPVGSAAGTGGGVARSNRA